MLCSQIRLTERRRRYYGVPQESVLPPSSSTILKGACSSTGIVSRPCLIRNVSEASSKKIRGSGECKKDDTDSNSQFNDDGDHHRSVQVDSSRREKIKLPLRVFSVRIHPGTKTMAPEDIRRDPRKLPSFCEQLKQIKRTRSRSDQPSSNDLMICGTEITTGSNQESVTQLQRTLNTSDELSNLGDPVESENLHIELTECCQCLHGDHAFDRLKIGKFLEEECQVKVFGEKCPDDAGSVDCARSQVLVSLTEVDSEAIARAAQVISVQVNSKNLDDNDLVFNCSD